MSSLYFYAVLDSEPSRLGRGLAGEPLRLVRSGGVVAVVGEMRSTPTPDPEALRGHDAAMRRIARRATALLPSRFGILFSDEKALRQTLESRTDEIQEALRLVAGCEQMTLRVFGEGAAHESSGPEDDSLGPGARYLSARSRVLHTRESVPEIEPLRKTLANLVHAERAVRSHTPPLLASVYHLVARGGGRAYRQRIQRAAPSLEPVRVIASGPWVPYAFGPGELS